MKRNNPDVELILTHADEFSKAVLDMTRFLTEIEEEPKRLFTEGQDRLHSTRSEIFKVLDFKNPTDKTHKKSTFLEYLASVLQVYVTEWAKKQGITEEVHIRVRHPNSFPSKMAIYSADEHEVIQFDIFHQFYGTRDMERNRNPEESIKKRIAFCEEHILECNKEIEVMEDVKKNPFMHVKGIKDIILVIRNRKKLVATVNKHIQRQEFLIEREKREIERLKKWVPQALSREDTHVRIAKLFVPMFQELGYREETEQHKLF